MSHTIRWKRPTPVPVSYAVPTESSSPKVAGAFAAGCGGHATNDAVLQPGAPMALFGSPDRHELLLEHIATGQDWYYVDHSYFRRGRQYRIARNRYQSFIDPAEVIAKYDALRAARGGGPLPTPTRFANLHVDVAPDWQREGTAILICPNSPTYMRWFGLDAKQWTLDIAAQLSRYSDRPVIIRWKAQAQARPLYLDLHTAHAVVTFSSGSAMEALAAGVPVFCTAPWATAYPMGCPDLSQIETPLYPEHRIPFLWELAERQWTLDEIRNGAAWRWFLSRSEEAI